MKRGVKSLICWSWPVALICLVSQLLISSARSAAPAAATAETPAEHGYRLLLTKPYLPPDFDQETFDELWKTWEEPLRSQAETATPDERRKLAFSRYGLHTDTGDASGKPQQYVVDRQGNWTMSCLACHQGKVA